MDYTFHTDSETGALITFLRRARRHVQSDGEAVRASREKDAGPAS
ncbi:hypothetical protein J2Y66_003010 [Paenarthrobacter nitroguajacolicus]|nr:hypothetical protein [Paenarthrobacter nitroguajacolicus]